MKIIRKILLILTLKCSQASLMLSRAEEEELDSVEKIALRFHLMICHSCRRFEKQLSFLRRIFARLSKNEFYESDNLPGMTEESKDRIKKNISEKF